MCLCDASVWLGEGGREEEGKRAVCLHLCSDAHVGVRGPLWGVRLAFHDVGSGDQTKAVRLSNKCLYGLNHLDMNFTGAIHGCSLLYQEAKHMNVSFFFFYNDKIFSSFAVILIDSLERIPLSFHAAISTSANDHCLGTQLGECLYLFIACVFMCVLKSVQMNVCSDLHVCHSSEQLSAWLF